MARFVPFAGISATTWTVVASRPTHGRAWVPDAGREALYAAIGESLKPGAKPIGYVATAREAGSFYLLFKVARP